jgi:hypothetical protein
MLYQLCQLATAAVKAAVMLLLRLLVIVLYDATNAHQMRPALSKQLSADAINTDLH